ncbi:ATP-dependent zinc metalloprotease FtsH [Bdellovibrio svalbardensis]|uniref:ATP-dependent zinc metalloprotease FtsH n=1 Tax=Bdellovibrio svalbardensis TaxID=2972972 RepID=A0ABT6DL72_9BACT|nr:ATP-dependent zinc metalloprotease FtsH [Bdellovibrio svalbardensis]MDG0817401.1 ATP-dependent zinc metalloprotease FtsH [Bdellovibrio svalbardensis]
MFKDGRYNVLLMFFAFLLVFLLQNIWMQASRVESIPYSEFETLVKSHEVDNLVLTEKYIRGDFKSARPSKKNQFITVRVEPELAKSLEGSGVTYSREIESSFFRDILSWTLPALIFIGLWIFVSRRIMERGGGVGGLMSVGKSRAKLYVETEVKTTFDDVAGVDEAKAELREVVEFLKNPFDYERLGARMPKGILLIGPPGTGKTMLAKAVAGEAKVPFFSISGSEFVELFVGVGAARVRDLFEQARKQAPCIIFIDELDALGKVRAPGMLSGGHDEKEQTLNQLLAELDGFDTKSGVVLLGATNRPEVLDPALLRSGRFDRQVLVDRPDKAGREAILKVHLKKIKIHESVNLEHIASLTPGFTGADLANLVNEAALIATRRKSNAVEEEDFVMAMERIVAGLEKKNKLLNPKERRIVAFHEMGHTLVACALPDMDKVQKVSIIPRGIGSLGYTIQRPLEDRYLMTQKELQNKMAVLMGGRVAESLIFDEISTGAADDLVKVTNIAEALVTKYGMSRSVGNVIFEQQGATFLEGSFPNVTHRDRSEESAKLIDSEIKRVIEEATTKTRKILEANRGILEKGAQLLLEKETLLEADIKTLIKDLVVEEGASERISRTDENRVL